jgi:hypothetical protein
MLCFITPNKKISKRKALAFNWDRCCHLVLCLWLTLFHLTEIIWLPVVSVEIEVVGTELRQLDGDLPVHFGHVGHRRRVAAVAVASICPVVFVATAGIMMTLLDVRVLHLLTKLYFSFEYLRDNTIWLNSKLYPQILD